MIVPSLVVSIAVLLGPDDGDDVYVPEVRPASDQKEIFSLSGGVAQLRDDHASAEDFIRAADEALYRAKRAGGQQIVMHVIENEAAEVL